MPTLVCIGCGCTDENPCLNLAGQPCAWVAVNEGSGNGLCTECAGKPIEELLAQESTSVISLESSIPLRR